MVGLDFNRIVRIKDIRAKKSELSEEESRLSSPLLTDRSYIPKIKEIFFEEAVSDKASSVQNRKKLIFILLYLYAPSALAGGKMPKNLREEINQALGVHSKSVVSNNCTDVIFLYEHYADFKKDVQLIYETIVNRLNEREVVGVI